MRKTIKLLLHHTVIEMHINPTIPTKRSAKKIQPHFSTAASPMYQTIYIFLICRITNRDWNTSKSSVITDDNFPSTLCCMICKVFEILRRKGRKREHKPYSNNII
jgi:hypothetical protein